MVADVGRGFQNRCSEGLCSRTMTSGYSAADVLKVHEATGVRCVFDYQHHWCFNPEGLPLMARPSTISPDLAKRRQT